MAHTSPQGSQKQSPPPYTPQQTEPEAFLDELIQVEQHKSMERNACNRLSPSEIETNRLRNMLMFTLSIDYKCTSDTALSAGDRGHFTDLYYMLTDLQRAHDNAPPTNTERKELAPYFWKYLHEPCRELGVPVDMVLRSIYGLIKFVNCHGGYKGSCFGLLHGDGLHHLATKLWFDQTIMIPAVFERGPQRDRMLTGVKEVRVLYFDSISGIDGSTAEADGCREHRCRRPLDSQQIVYEANARGLSYEELRKQGTTASIMSLSLRHMSLQAKQCVKKILERHTQVTAGNRKADTLTSWRGDGHPKSKSEGHRPCCWREWTTYHLPDFFESGSTKETNDL